MAVFSKVVLDAMTNGVGILVNDNATPGELIHTGSANTDEVWMWATNKHTGNVLLTIEWGSSTTAINPVSVPFNSGAILVIPGWITTSTLTLRVFAATQDVVSVFGFVNRLT